MNYKNLYIVLMLLLLSGCGRFVGGTHGAGGSSVAAAAVSTCSPTVTLSSSAPSINESATGTLTITSILSCAVQSPVTVTIGTSGTATEGSDYNNISKADDIIKIMR